MIFINTNMLGHKHTDGKAASAPGACGPWTCFGEWDDFCADPLATLTAAGINPDEVLIYDCNEGFYVPFSDWTGEPTE